MIPILIIAYNRPDSLLRLLDSIRQQAHGKIFIHCDGPRNEEDAGSKMTQKLVRELYQEGFLEKYYLQEENLGLMDSVHFAADWFFEFNEFGLVLEDDLVLNPPVLSEAEILFTELKSNPSVGVFCLANPLPRKVFNKFEGSYWFSNFFVSYAWATSSENWKESRRTILDTDIQEISGFMRSHFGLVVERNFSKFLKMEALKETKNRKKCSFAWRFTIDQILNHKKVIISKHNRVGYSGFGANSTNTSEDEIWGSDFGKLVDKDFYQWVQPQSEQPSDAIDGYFVRDYKIIRSALVFLAIRTRIQRLIDRKDMFRH